MKPVSSSARRPVTRRTDRSYRPVLSDGLGAFRLEEKRLAIPMFFLSPTSGPNLLNSTTAGGPNFTYSASNGGQQGVGLASGTALNNSYAVGHGTFAIPTGSSASGITGSFQSSASTSLTLPTTTSTLEGISINSTIINQYQLTNKNGGLGATNWMGGFNFGTVNMGLASQTNSTLGGPGPWTPPEYIQGSIGVTFIPINFANAPGGFTVVQSIGNASSTGLSTTGPTSFVFTSAATGVFARGPVVDPATGDPTSLAVTYPTYVGGGVSGNDFTTTDIDGFFANTGSGGSVTIPYSIMSTAPHETINWSSSVEDVITGDETATYHSELDFHFDETVSAPNQAP